MKALTLSAGTCLATTVAVVIFLRKGDQHRYRTLPPMALSIRELNQHDMELTKQLATIGSGPNSEALQLRLDLVRYEIERRYERI